MTLPVWTFQEKSEFPEFSRLCKESWDYHLKSNTYKKGDKHKWELTVINKDKLRSLVPESYIPNNFSSLPQQHQANVSKLAVLREHGGVWIDSSVILCQDFKWIEEQLQTYSLLGYCLYEHGSRTNAVIDTYFFAVRKGDLLIGKTHELFVKITEDELVDMELPLKSKWSKDTNFYSLPLPNRKQNYMQVVMMYLRQFDPEIKAYFEQSKAQLYSSETNGPLEHPLKWSRRQNTYFPITTKLVKFKRWAEPIIKQTEEGKSKTWMRRLMLDNVPSYALRTLWFDRRIESYTLKGKNHTHNDNIHYRKKKGSATDKYMVDIHSKARTQEIAVGAGCKKIPSANVHKDNSFVLKGDNSSGNVVIVINGRVEYASHIFKKGDDVKIVRKNLDRLNDFWSKHPGSEKWYRKIPYKMVVEKMVQRGDFPYTPDYKFHVFNDKIELVQIHYNRFIGTHSVAYTDENYNVHPTIKCINPKIPKRGLLESKPSAWDRMCESVLTLAKPFVYIRVDMYLDSEDNVYCGEMTLSPNSGHTIFEPTNTNKTWMHLWAQTEKN